MALKPEMANMAGNIIDGGGPEVLHRSPVTTPMIAVLNPDIHEIIQKPQTIIVARALKIGGISPSFWFYSSPAL
jgi:hypothetical protein